jgi:hypothetical protein
VAVLRSWPHLTKLVLNIENPRKEFGPDSILTGVPSSELEKLKRLLEKMPRPLNLEGLKATVACLKTQRALADMGQLQEFTMRIHPDDCWWEPMLSDLSVYFGLALAGPRLQRVVIQDLLGFRFTFVTKEAADFLRCALGPGALIDLGKPQTSKLGKFE